MDGDGMGQCVTHNAEVEITGLNHVGQGVGRLADGAVVFVSGALPGETVRVQVTHRSRRHTEGRLLELIVSSGQRRRPPCILADHCGGCSLQPLSYAAQLEAKLLLVQAPLQRIAQLAHAPEPVLASASELGYRNRAVIPLERRDDGRLRAGFYRRGSHQIVNMNHCPVLDPRLDALIQPLKQDLEASDLPIDRHGETGGGLRHLALRIGHHSGEILIALISSHRQLPGVEALAQHWLARWPAVQGVVLNHQPKPGNTLFGDTTIALAGREHVIEQFCGLDFDIGCDTFFQVNTLQAERVLPLLLAAMPAQGLRIIDAYCGVGAYTLPLAAAGHRCIGLELQPAAVELARRNARRNGLDQQAHFAKGPVAELLKDKLTEGADVVLVDPPRKGLEKAVTETLLESPVKTLLYLSCDPATQARDLQLLVASGPYRISRIQPLDFFPNTSHIETLVTLNS